jgi:YD repeat-containing protein
MPYDNKEGVSALVKENILIPVEISEYVIKDSKEYFTGASHTVYDYRNGIPVPVKEYKIETKNMLTDFSPCIRLFDGKEVIYYEKDDSYIEKFLYTRYDDKGNVLEMKDKASGLTICYIWGYNFEQPIAKVVNASYSDIEDVIGSDMTMLNYGYKFVGETPLELTDNDVCKMLDILRYKLPEAHVTTYTYKPLVGMTSETDVNGVTIYYEYDNFNRLKCIKNHDGNILKYYEYNHLNSKSDVNYIKENNRNKVQCKVSGGKGSVYPDWQFNIIKGTNKVIDLKPAEGMEVKDIIINGMSVKDAEFNDKINPIGKITQYTLKNITADTEVEVMFSKKRYGIYLSDNIDNLPLPDQVIDAFVEHGGNYSVNFPLSERGIPFKELQINGVVVGNSPNYTITDITEDKRVKAIYKGEEPQSGLITDDSGNPVLGVKVEVCLDSYGNLDVLETVTTGADGRFKLSKFYYSEQNPQNPERFAIRVSHSGYTFSTPIKVLNGVGDYDYTATKN